MTGGILVEATFDPAILCERQIKRKLKQFEHTIQLLMEIPLQTKWDKLQLLNPHDASEILQWSKTIPEPVRFCIGNVFNIDTLSEATVWIVSSQNMNELVSIGGVGELLLEGSDLETKTAVSSILPPSWATSSAEKRNRFYSTG